jgi:hypothetical protein
VYATIDGAGISGFERLRTLLYGARFRYIRVNGGLTYRLVPGTTGDGLLMAMAPHADYPPPFSLSPAARTIAVFGASGTMRVSFYWLPVRA